MAEKSLDPRVNRLNINYDNSDFRPLQPMDEQTTYECFVQLKSGKPYVHVGIVHAPTLELAFVTAKEQYSRRLTCTGLWVVPSDAVSHSAYAPVNQSIFDLLEPNTDLHDGPLEEFEIFYQPKRGTQHKLAGMVSAKGAKGAFDEAKKQFSNKKAVNLWAIPRQAIRKSTEEELPIWDMLPEKSYREAFEYKVKDRIKKYKERQMA